MNGIQDVKRGETRERNLSNRPRKARVLDAMAPQRSVKRRWLGAGLNSGTDLMAAMAPTQLQAQAWEWQ